MGLKKGDIVLVNFPFDTLKRSKKRPAIVIWTKEDNMTFTLIMITSKELETLRKGEFIISKNHPEFYSTGLLTSSKVRAYRMVTLHKSLILGKLGYLGKRLQKELNEKIKEAFDL